MEGTELASPLGKAHLQNRRNRRAKGKSILRLEDVSVKFHHLWALRNITLNIERSEFLFLTGVSGAGKTTLLRVIAGDLLPTSGRILHSQQLAFVATIFQDLRLLDGMSCMDNLQLCYDTQIYRSQREFLDDLKQLSKILHIDDRLNGKLADANRGLKQKVAILRALLSRPDILLADEPTSALDKDNAFQLFDLFNFYNSKRKMTIIWASHHRELVRQFNGKIIHINNGRLAHRGHACFI